VSLFVCLSVRFCARCDWLAENKSPPTNRVFAFIYTNVKSPSLHGLHGRNTRYLYNVCGIVVSVLACHAQDRRFDSRNSQHMQMASFYRAMQRETIPDTKNVNASN
jgi:hypothetical protein